VAGFEKGGAECDPHVIYLQPAVVHIVDSNYYARLAAPWVRAEQCGQSRMHHLGDQWSHR
jgi:hypothetical protein